jgi:hypothetical protein
MSASKPVVDPRYAAFDVRRLVREQAVVRLVPGRKPVVEPSSAPEVRINFPVCERAVEKPGVVEGGVTDPRVAPIDHADETAVSHEQVLRTKIGVEEGRFEARERLDVPEEPPCSGAPVAVEHGEDEPFELHALVAVSLDPVLSR